VESFVKLYLRQNQEESLPRPDELLDALHRDRPKLYQYFRPTPEQVAFFLISNYRKGGELSSDLFSTLLENGKKAKEQEEAAPITQGQKKRDLKKKQVVKVEVEEEPPV